MDVFRLRRRLVDDYGSYVSSFIRIKDDRVEEEVLSNLAEGLLWPDPLIQLNPSFEAGETIDELVGEGILHEECAQSDVWTTVHLGEYFGFLFLLGGLVALYYSVSARPGAGAGLAPFGLAAAVVTAASFTVLQAVDGITLRYAIDAWTSAPAPQKPAAFAAAEVARWTEIGMNALSYFLAGLTLFLFGLAIALGRAYPRWVGLIAAISGAALMYNGAVEVAYEGFVSSIIKLVGLLLLAVWAFIMAALMLRNGNRRRIARLGPTSQAAAQRPGSTR